MTKKRTSENDEEWGPWIIHDGQGCPVKPGVIVDVVCTDRFGFSMRTITTVEGGSYSSWDWSHFPKLKKIVRYREKKPRGLKILEEALLTDKAPEVASRLHVPEFLSYRS